MLPNPAIPTRGSSRPTVCVVIPIFNHANFLFRALSSVVWQLLKSDELIVVNDASPDIVVEPSSRQGIVEALPEQDPLFAFRHKIFWIHNEKRMGVSASRNRAIKLARAEWIKFLDADDILAAYALDLLRNGNVDSSVNVVAGGCHRIIDGSYADYLCDTEESLRNILSQIPMLPSATFVRRSTFEKVGYFDEEIDLEEDWDLWLRIHEAFGPTTFAVTTAPVCYYWINSRERRTKIRTGTRRGQPIRDYFRERYGVSAH